MRVKDEEKQQRIKKAMIRLFLEEGMNGTSISKIAREANVSAATIYVYYKNKEEMLSQVYREYSQKSYTYLKKRIHTGMDAGSLIEAIVRGCYDFSVEYADVFSFVEQCSRCPSLAEYVSHEECCCDIMSILHDYQKRGEIRPIRDLNTAAILFAPVHYIAMYQRDLSDDTEDMLKELIQVMCDALVE